MKAVVLGLLFFVGAGSAQAETQYTCSSLGLKGEFIVMSSTEVWWSDHALQMASRGNYIESENPSQSRYIPQAIFKLVDFFSDQTRSWSLAVPQNDLSGASETSVTISYQHENKPQDEFIYHCTIVL